MCFIFSEDITFNIQLWVSSSIRPFQECYKNDCNQASTCSNRIFSGFWGALIGDWPSPFLFFYIHFLSLMVSSFSSHVSLASTKLVLPENKNNTNPLLYIHIIWQLFLQKKSHSDSYLPDLDLQSKTQCKRLIKKTEFLYLHSMVA